MKKTILLIGLLFIVFICCSLNNIIYSNNPKTHHNKKIKIASYNVRFLYDNNKDRFDDPYTNDEQRKSKSQNSLIKLANTIKKIDADILALQEVESIGVLKWFNKEYLKNKAYPYVILIEGNNRVGIDIALLSRIPIYSATSHRTMTIKNKKGYYKGFARDFLLVKIILPNMPITNPLFIGVVHLKSSYGGYNKNQEWRILEVKMIGSIIDDLKRLYPNLNLIILGDFNDKRKSPVLKHLTKKKSLIDLFEYDKIKMRKRLTHPSHKPKKQLDYILISNNLIKSYIKKSIKIYKDKSNTNKASDHLPIMCQIKIN